MMMERNGKRLDTPHRQRKGCIIARGQAQGQYRMHLIGVYRVVFLHGGVILPSC